MRGNVANIVEQKNFGFIRCGETEFFFHKSDFNGHWEDLVKDFKNKKRGQAIEVTFEEVYSQKGPRASGVSRTDFPNQAV